MICKQQKLPFIFVLLGTFLACFYIDLAYGNPISVIDHHSKSNGDNHSPPSVITQKQTKNNGSSLINGVAPPPFNASNSDDHWYHLLVHASSGFQHRTGKEGFKSETGPAQIYAFNTLFRVGLALICPKAEIADPKWTILRFFQLHPMHMSHPDEERTYNMSNSESTPNQTHHATPDQKTKEETTLTANQKHQKNESLVTASELGISEESWSLLVSLSKGIVKQTQTVKADEISLRKIVQRVLDTNPLLRSRLELIARTVFPECAGNKTNDKYFHSQPNITKIVTPNANIPEPSKTKSTLEKTKVSTTAKAK